jgi:hypothetical protein
MRVKRVETFREPFSIIKMAYRAIAIANELLTAAYPPVVLRTRVKCFLAMLCGGLGSVSAKESISSSYGGTDQSLS